MVTYVQMGDGSCNYAEVAGSSPVVTTKIYSVKPWCANACSIVGG